MDFLKKLERKFGRYAIHNLMLYIIGLNAAGLVLYYINPELLTYFCWNFDAILHGQVWRLVTFMMIPNDINLLMFALYAFIYYSIGNALERAWGCFLQNLYIIVGILGHILGAIAVYFLFNHYNMTMLTTNYLSMSLFLALAITYPDMQFLLYFIIPIKAKWMAAISLGFLVLEFISGGLATRVMIILSLLNFFLFAFLMLRQSGFSPKTFGRRMERRMDFRQKAAQVKPMQKPIHKCVVCGKTNLDFPDMEFRYCSKCVGAREYCMDHLYTHIHVTEKDETPVS